jgi:hypothetical protein
LKVDDLHVNGQLNDGKLESEMFLAEVLGGYQFSIGKSATCDAMAGIRYLRIDNTLQVYSAGSSHSHVQELVDPFVLIRPSFVVWPSKIDGLRFNLTAGIGGGGDSELIYELFPEFTYQVNKRFIVRGGYRAVGWEVDGSDDSDLDFSLSGLVVGVGILF